MNFKQKLMACTALLGVWLLHPATAGAQSADAQKIEKLERQTELLQQQLKEIQQELARTRKQTERVEASRSRAGALFGPAAHGYQGPATAASAGKGEGDAGRLHRRGNGLAPTQHGQRHWNGLRDNPVSVFTALQRARISRDRPAEPNLAAGRGQHRSLPETFRVSSRTSWASARRRITTRATAGLRACDTLISPMTTLVGEVGDFTSSPARPGAWRHKTRSI